MSRGQRGQRGRVAVREPEAAAHRPTRVTHIRDLLAAVALLGILAGCSTMGGSTDPSRSPSSVAQTAAPSATLAAASSTPSPLIESTPSLPALTIETALAAVVAEVPRYDGYPLRAFGDPATSPGPVVGEELVGQSRWVIGREVSAGIELTFVTGSGDCPAGCIEHALETYLVEPDETVTFICGESDEPSATAPRSTGRVMGLPFEPCADVPR